MRQRLTLLLLSPICVTCTDSTAIPTDAPVEGCSVENLVFEEGSAEGHADPFGAASAGQARAGRVAESWLADGRLPQPAHGRQRIEPGDYLLVNDSIAVVIEGPGLSDGYGRFGGSILALDLVEDGTLQGVSRYVETLFGWPIQELEATSVTVLNDGSDGGPAVVRARGKMTAIPFLEEGFGALFGSGYGFELAMDYTLAPGEQAVTVTASVLNHNEEPVDFGINRPGSDELYGFFQGNHNRAVTEEFGYADASGFVRYMAFDGGDAGFAFANAAGEPLEFGFEQSGFNLYWGPGWIGEACSITTSERLRIVVGGPQLDGLKQAIREDAGETGWRVVDGTLTDWQGTPLPDTYVHMVDEAGTYLSRTMTDSMGRYELHAPNELVTIVPTPTGYPFHAGDPLAPDVDTLDLTMAPHATLDISATDLDTAELLPVRIQVIPVEPVATHPASFGLRQLAGGRIHQEYVVEGETQLVVPPGTHRVVISRGYEFELSDTEVTVAAGDTLEHDVQLEHSVDTTNVMSGDFHIHTQHSADSSDGFEKKVRGALADGLEIPVSTEHEWVVDFQPIIESLGAERWGYGMAGLELTTFSWGHFGVVPMTPNATRVNNGAVDWVGKVPAEVFTQVDQEPNAPVLIVNHPSGGGFGAYFSSARFDRETGMGESELWDDNFDVVEVFNDDTFDGARENGVLEDWFALLNAGQTKFAVGSSDSHRIDSSPVGWPRTYMRLGTDDPRQIDALDVRDALGAGASTISGGLYMTVVGPDGAQPGETRTGSGPQSFTVTVQAPSWITADELEIVVNGQTVATEPLLPYGQQTANVYVVDVDVDIDVAVPRSWVVFHARSSADLGPVHPGRTAFAASNPIFFTP